MSRSILALLLAFWLCIGCAQATPSGTANNIILNSQLGFGTQAAYPNVLFQYVEPVATTAQMNGSTIVKVTANTTDNAYSMATLFPGWVTPVAIGIADVTDPGIQTNIGLSSGGPRLHMAANGFLLMRVDTSNMPTLYIDNPSATDDALIQIFGISN